MINVRSIITVVHLLKKESKFKNSLYCREILTRQFIDVAHTQCLLHSILKRELTKAYNDENVFKMNQ